MNLVNKFFSEIVVSSIGWTIIHSIWQGLVIAAVFFTIMVFLKKSGSNLRYIIGIAILILTVLITLITFVTVFNAEVAKTLLEKGIPQSTSLLQAKQSGFLLTLEIYFEKNMPAVVTLWLLGMMFFFFKFLSGILYNQRLKNYNLKEVSDYWKEKVNELCLKLRIKKQVQIMESTVINVPLVIGHIKPVILFPVGMLAGIPGEQVEALIMHELAHVFRKDYLINIFQNIIDIFYFYHPGIKWISNQVRNERENCCDDITVLKTGNSFDYAKALVTVGENSINPKEDLAMAATKNSEKLFKRIRRLLKMKNNSFKFNDGFVSFMVMLVFLFSFVICVNASNKIGPNSSSFEIPAGDSSNQDKVGKSKKIEILKAKYQELLARKSKLSKSEKTDFEKIAKKLQYLKEQEYKKKYQAIKEDVKKLESKKNLTKDEKVKLKKYYSFLKQSELKKIQEQDEKKFQKIVQEYKILKQKGDNLTQKEKDKLKKITSYLKKEQQQKQKKLQKLEKEYKKLSEKGKKLNKKEKEKLAKIKEYMIQLKKQQHEKQAYEKKRSQEKIKKIKAEYKKLSEKGKKLNKEEKEKLAKIKEYMIQLKKEQHEKQVYEEKRKEEKIKKIKVEYKQLSENQKNLSEEEKKKLEKLKQILIKIKKQKDK